VVHHTTKNVILLFFVNFSQTAVFTSHHSRTAFFEQNTLHDDVGGAQGTLQEPLDVFPYIVFIKSDILPTVKVTDASDQLAASISTFHSHRCENLTRSIF